MSEFTNSVASAITATAHTAWFLPSGRQIALRLECGAIAEGPTPEMVRALYPDAVASDTPDPNAWPYAYLTRPVSEAGNRWDEELCALYPERAHAAKAALGEYRGEPTKGGTLHRYQQVACEAWAAA